MTRAVTPALGVVVLAAVTVILAAFVGVATVSTAPPPDPPSPFALSASANASTDDSRPTVRITLTHQSPTPVDVREIEIRIAVDGERLEHQPRVPFFSVTGFVPGPTGPFNVASDPTWERGEPASLRIAVNSNSPPVEAGDRVRIEIYRDGLPIAATETTVG